MDVLVAGAGPAGALAARELARDGLEVRLVDRAVFPRSKVCGGCLGAAGAGVLREAGLGRFLDARGAPLDSLRCAAGRWRVEVPLTGGAVIERGAFDLFLAGAAAAAGVRFQDGVRAELQPERPDEPWRRVVLVGKGCREEVRARLVLDATGLGAGLDGGLERPAAPDSRIGLAWLLSPSASDLAPGTVEMAVGQGGYVGLVRLADGRLDLAAAFDPIALRGRSPAEAVAELRSEAGLGSLAGLARLRPRGTPALTRRPPRVAGGRRLALGDAAGYVEPFTGEGLGWALEGAWRLSALVRDLGLADAGALEAAWERCHRTYLIPRQRTCARIARLLRRPRLVAGLLGAAALAPRLSGAWLARLAGDLHRPLEPTRRMRRRGA